MPEPNTESYAASKGGLVALALSIGPDVRVNCISPGWIATKNYGALRRNDHAQHPAGRVGRPQDIAEIAAWRHDAQDDLRGVAGSDGPGCKLPSPAWH